MLPFDNTAVRLAERLVPADQFVLAVLSSAISNC